MQTFPSLRSSRRLPVVLSSLFFVVGSLVIGLSVSQVTNLGRSQDTRSQAATSCSGMTESTCKTTAGCNWTPGSTSTQTHSCLPVNCDDGDGDCAWQTKYYCTSNASTPANIECESRFTQAKCTLNGYCDWKSSTTCNGTYTTSSTTPGSCSGTVATPSPKPNYQSCSVNSDCQSNNCQAASGGKFCFPAGVDPSAPVPAGGTCGTTAYDRVCVTGYTCQSNKCQLSPTSSTPPTSSPKPNYQSCSANSDCQSNNCQAASGGKFCFPAGVDPSAPVPAGGTCGTTAYDRVCVTGYTCQSNKCQPPPTPRPNNASCNQNADCQSGNCQPASGGKFCLPAGSQTVSLVPAGGTCGTTAYDRQCVDNYTCRANKCLLVDYQSCSSASQCASNNCQAASGGKFCFPTGVSPTPSPIAAGGTCGTTAYDRECVTGYTCQNNKCALPQTAATIKKALGERCNSATECQSNNCDTFAQYEASAPITYPFPVCVPSTGAQAQMFDTSLKTQAAGAAAGTALYAAPIVLPAAVSYATTHAWVTTAATVANFADDGITLAQCLVGKMQDACAQLAATLMNPIPGAGLVDDAVDIASLLKLKNRGGTSLLNNQVNQIFDGEIGFSTARTSITYEELLPQRQVGLDAELLDLRNEIILRVANKNGSNIAVNESNKVIDELVALGMNENDAIMTVTHGIQPNYPKSIEERQIMQQSTDKARSVDDLVSCPFTVCRQNADISTAIAQSRDLQAYYTSMYFENGGGHAVTAIPNGSNFTYIDTTNNMVVESTENLMNLWNINGFNTKFLEIERQISDPITGSPSFDARILFEK